MPKSDSCNAHQSCPFVLAAYSAVSKACALPSPQAEEPGLPARCARPVLLALTASGNLLAYQAFDNGAISRAAMAAQATAAARANAAAAAKVREALPLGFTGQQTQQCCTDPGLIHRVD